MSDHQSSSASKHLRPVLAGAGGAFLVLIAVLVTRRNARYAVPAIGAIALLLRGSTSGALARIRVPTRAALAVLTTAPRWTTVKWRK